MLASTRRTFLILTAARTAAAAITDWNADAILARIKPPVFPDREFNTVHFAASSDSQQDSSEAIQKAIAACSRAGGGRVPL